MVAHQSPLLAKSARLVVIGLLGGFLWLYGIRGPAQTAQVERRFPTSHGPTISVSNADNISIFRTDGDTVSFSASSSLGDLTADDIKTQGGKDAVDITCPVPRRPSEY